MIKYEEVKGEIINLFKDLSEDEKKSAFEYMEKIMEGPLSDLIDKGKEEKTLSKEEIIKTFEEVKLDKNQIKHACNTIKELGIVVTE